MSGLGVIDHAHFLHRAWRYRLRTEKQELAYVRSIRLVGRTVIDIGAHRGIYSYWLREAVGPTGRVVSFEPQPEMIAELKKFKASFRANNMEIVESGLSDTPGSATLNRIGDHTGGASLEHNQDPNATTFSVPVTTLDAYLGARDLGPVALIKCDVEGHERAVFRGATRTLTEDRPVMLFECHDQHAREGGVFEDLKQFGYKGWMLDGRRRIPIEHWATERPKIKMPYLNYIFEPQSR
ncbi:MAG: FkbM family methyltransferase [Phycisphaerales bacterium]